MRTSWIIALREMKERIGSRQFILMSLIGPLAVLAIVFMLFKFGGNDQQKWNVLIVDPSKIMENKILSREDKNITYSFADNYIEIEQFAKDARFQKYDAFVEVNEKVLSNKSCFVFYREKPSFNMSVSIRFQVERRLEEVIALRFTSLNLSQFRKIKQPLNFAFKNVYDPSESASDTAGWAGLFFGTIIFVFIFMFGMTVLRSITREKSNRIVEVIMASAKPRSMLSGKILGIGVSAFIQVAIWITIIGIGLYYMRSQLFVDWYDPSQAMENRPVAYNQFIELVFERMQFSVMIPFFMIFLIVGYWFYATIFAGLGAVSGSESDGQQFLLPLVAVLCFAVYAGYYVVQNPDSPLATFYLYFPFTAPIVAMVKLALGFAPGTSYQLYLSLMILGITSWLSLLVAGRLYKNGILQFGHHVRLSMIFNWLKKN